MSEIFPETPAAPVGIPTLGEVYWQTYAEEDRAYNGRTSFGNLGPVIRDAVEKGAQAVAKAAIQRRIDELDMRAEYPNGSSGFLGTTADLDGSAPEPPPAMSARLRAAEAVCTLFSWTGSSMSSDRDKALHELWWHWVQVSGVSLTPKDHPELSNDVITELARLRDETRAATLARIFASHDGEAAQ